MLQARFAIVWCPAHSSDKDTLAKIMTCCVVLHDMVIADERDTQMAKEYDNVSIPIEPHRHTKHIQTCFEA